MATVTCNRFLGFYLDRSPPWKRHVVPLKSNVTQNVKVKPHLTGVTWAWGEGAGITDSLRRIVFSMGQATA